MIYNVTSSFTRISETAGTIQNNSYIYPIEVSNQAVADSGILLYPLNKFSFSGTQLYLRCIEGGGRAEIRIVPFTLDFGISQGGTSTATDSQTATDDDANAIINDGWNHIYTAPDDVNAVIDDMLNNTDPIDTGDGFSDYISDLFP